MLDRFDTPVALAAVGTIVAHTLLGRTLGLFGRTITSLSGLVPR